MTDRNIRYLCILPGIGHHLLSFMNPEWLVGCVFDASNWYLGPKLHVLPRLFNLRQKFFHIRVLLSQFCQQHVCSHNTSAGTLKFLTSQYYLSKLVSLRREFEALPSHPYICGLKTVTNWKNYFHNHWVSRGLKTISFAEFQTVHDPSRFHSTCSKKEWRTEDLDFLDVHPSGAVVGCQHWLRDEAWGTTVDMEKFWIQYICELRTIPQGYRRGVYDNI